ncbi:MAG: DUF1841 domain-containing protein [endosymbiont of Galathealinum brachiosum]|uniref:DUF1841 domain-containing protein n=1 Tax=endosymbiont of Galathealinum brachiosum TaxID=2200906 RepID=A0A370DBF7_9GAMM|nr:MAG: DUF1841 domain-containing protein [endosymbiont of Galathealinum brachiosum]
MFGNDRNQLRKMYKTAWEKFQQQTILTPLEIQITDVIKEHPEYHDFVLQLDKDFLPESGETNPFLHMGLHLGLREQLATNRPQGITDIYQRLIKIKGSAHDAEHSMIECLAEAMWSSQANNTPPDEAKYLLSLKKLLQI